MSLKTAAVHHHRAMDLASEAWVLSQGCKRPGRVHRDRIRGLNAAAAAAEAEALAEIRANVQPTWAVLATSLAWLWQHAGEPDKAAIVARRVLENAGIHRHFLDNMKDLLCRLRRKPKGQR